MMAPAQQPDATPPASKWSRLLERSTDTYGLVLLFIIVDYIAVSTLLYYPWGRVAVVALLGATLLFTLSTSRARRVWQLLAVLYLLASTFSALVVALAPDIDTLGQWTVIVGGLLLIATPFIILRRIGAHRVVTTETVLGAICVYLLLGFSFTFVYSAVAYLSAAPFFVGQPNAPINAYLFFSYSTLTTVGYGNLVPQGNLGQTLAMLEALSGQIYLVIVVARLVSLWGQTLPRSERRLRGGAPPTRDDESGVREDDPGGAHDTGVRHTT